MAERDSVNLEEELLAQQEEKFQRQQQIERRQAQEAQANSVTNRAREAAKDYAKSALKTVAKEQMAAAATTVGSTIISTAPIWGIPLIIILFMVGVTVMTVTTVKAVCDGSVFDGMPVAVGKVIVAAIPGDVCGMLSAATQITPGETVIVNPNTPPPTTGGLTDSEARRLLANANICNYPTGFSRIDCVNAAEPQTSLNGIHTATLNEVIRLKADCDIWARANNQPACTVVVTGGTETTGGHAGGPCSHLSGHKIDIGISGTITQFIRSFPGAGSRSGDPLYRNPNTSVIYADEGNHWDIGGVGCV